MPAYLDRRVVSLRVSARYETLFRDLVQFYYAALNNKRSRRPCATTYAYVRLSSVGMECFEGDPTAFVRLGRHG